MKMKAQCMQTYGTVQRGKFIALSAHKKKVKIEENLREWDSRDGGRTEMRARKGIS